jgi:hypothetical protein
MIRALAIVLLLLSGCGSFRNSVGLGGENAEVVIVRPPPVYSRSEVDAITAELQCRQLARTMLEAQRCGIRR